jgi:hypothetical protein
MASSYVTLQVVFSIYQLFQRKASEKHGWSKFLQKCALSSERVEQQGKSEAGINRNIS